MYMKIIPGFYFCKMHDNLWQQFLICLFGYRLGFRIIGPPDEMSIKKFDTKVELWREAQNGKMQKKKKKKVYMPMYWNQNQDFIL